VKILYFASLARAVGVAEESPAPPAAVNTVGRLVDWLADASPRHAQAFAACPKLCAAVNQVYAGMDHAVADGDEVAFFPPVTGG
jgi:molybdopterin synthase sulfur carrier subunit